ncbi:hypothetical protein DL96DRAFT_1717550 [Flagelloscypha sp. PMI_526]|nr:hypothetical protein DL96DRAFT_1717550 [Flagelloscypha sp. PMI_526]
MVVPLPPPNSGTIPLPDQPSDPPTISDIKMAKRYLEMLSEEINMGQDEPLATEDDEIHARLYLHQLYEAMLHQSDPALRTPESIKEFVRETVADVVTKALAPIHDRLIHLTRVSSRAYNQGVFTGVNRNYEIIPFIGANGQEELPSNYGLPLLKTANIINTLSDYELDAYLGHYAIAHENMDRDTKVWELKTYLGVIDK